MNTFTKGFRVGDVIQKETDRYVLVQNGYQKFVVGDNGERRIYSIQLGEMVFGNIVKHGEEISLEELKSKH